MRKILTGTVLSAAVVALSGCGEFGGGASYPVGATPAAGDILLADSDAAAASSAGTVGDDSVTAGTKQTAGQGFIFKGKVVVDAPFGGLPLLHKAGDAVKDAEACAINDVPDERLVVGAGNGLANCFVYLVKAPKGIDIPAASEQALTVDQVSCRFIPHCMVVQAGQPVRVLSDDSVPHNAHIYAKKNREVNAVVQPKDRTGLEVNYARAEVEPVKVACDFHTWMAGWHLPLDHPFGAVTGPDGQFEFPHALPSGEYEFKVWHEVGGTLERKLKLTVDGSDATITVKLSDVTP